MSNKRKRIPKGQSKMDNPGKLAKQGTQDKEKQNKNTIRVGHHCIQTKTNNINKACALLQTIAGKYKPNIVFMRKS